MDSLFFQLMVSQLHTMPLLLAYSTVLAIIVIRRDTIPVDPLLTGLAFASFIAVILFNAGINFWRMSVMAEGMSLIETTTRVALFGSITVIIQLGAVVFLGVGIFRRNPRLT